jgi:Protein of unknown function (DUF2950)
MYAIQRFGAVTWLAVALAGAGGAPKPVPASDPAWGAERISTNEASAIDALRAIAEAQERFKAAVHVDTNCDGEGEYGYFAEIAGSLVLRATVGNPCQPAAGRSPDDLLLRPLLRRPFGIVRQSSISYRGYLFMMWLPRQEIAGKVTACCEDFGGGKMAAPFPDPVEGARMWCCYAWPAAYDLTGRRAFFVDQRGQVLECGNRSASPFSGRTLSPRPEFDEAYSIPGDMSSPLRIGIPNASGTIWSLVP